MADSYRDLWKEVDSFAEKSRKQYEHADEEIKRLPGWRFKGCPEGVVWIASHQKERLEVTARTAEALVEKVRAEVTRLAERDRKQAEADAQAKARGVR
jgi:membrane protein involved in colicin uptake